MDDTAVKILLGVISIVATIIGAWAMNSRVKTKADAEIKVAKVKDELSDSETARKEAEAELAERQFIMDNLKRQIAVNDQLSQRLEDEKTLYEKKLTDKEKQDESNYQVLKQTQNRIGQELHGVLVKRFDNIDKTLEALPAKLQDGNKEWVQTLVGELVTQMAERFAEATMAQEWYLFPDAFDPEWREDFVKPLVNKVRLYRRPVLSDNSLTDVTIMPTGETMDIIQGRKKGWLIVRLMRGTKALYGWLPEHEVTTGLAALKRATSEAQVAAITNPLPSTL